MTLQDPNKAGSDNDKDDPSGREPAVQTPTILLDQESATKEEDEHS